MTDRLQMFLTLLVIFFAYALATSAIGALALERNDCARINGGPVRAQWSVARGCWVEFYPRIVAPVGKRPAWLRLP